MTQVAIRKAVAASCEEQVSKLLRWDEQEYGQYKYETGLTFLEQYLPNDPDARRELEEHGFFWKWWRNMWLQREELFLEYADGLLWADRIAEYKLLNDPVMLADENTHLGRMIDDSYCEMAGAMGEMGRESLV